MTEDTKIVKGSPVVVLRRGTVRVGLSNGAIRKNQKRFMVSALGMKQRITVDANTEFVPVTIMVSKEVAELLKLNEVNPE